MAEFSLRIGKYEEGGNKLNNTELLVHERCILVVLNKQRLRVEEDRFHDPDRCVIAR